MPESESEKRESIRTAGTVLPDGRIVELLYDPASRRTALMVGTAEGVEIVNRVDAFETLLPMSPRNTLIATGSIVLPETLEGFGSVEALAADIEGYISRYVGLTAGFGRVAVAYILLSWVYDAFNELPYLRVRGDFGTGKTRALAVIGSLLYKGFFASGASTVSPIFHILNTFRGSLILDEADFRFSDEKAELSKILNNGNVAGFPVLRQTVNARKEFEPKAFQVYGPKIIASRHGFDDAALESRFLTEEMGSGKPAGVPKSLPDRQKAEALKLRNRLLAYRFVQRFQVAVTEDDDGGGRSDRTNQIIAPLLAVAPSEDHRASILAFATELDSDVRTDQSASLDAALIGVISALADTTDGDIPVGEIASRYGAVAGSDIERRVTPRYVGSLIRKRLRLKTHKSVGVYVVSATQRPRIAALAKRYGID